nr:reverse transcriptase domain-containing protein [Tanacetum cinerariifolium]
MVKEGIVLGHKISKHGLEVDHAKVDVIARLPYPTTVKGVKSFLGHAGFYRRFIQDFSKIARHMTHLLEKETPFVFSKDCVDAFETLKKKFAETSILVVPDWNLPFELMCDASNFAIAGGTDPAMGGFTDLTGIEFLVGGICTVINPDSDLQNIFVPQWNVTNSSRLDDGGVCREMLLKARDEEIDNLKAQMLLKEAQAAEAIRLRAEASNFKAAEKSFRDEVNTLNGRNTIFENECNALMTASVSYVNENGVSPLLDFIIVWVPFSRYLKIGVIQVSPSSSTTANISTSFMDFSFNSSTNTCLLKCAKLVEAILLSASAFLFSLLGLV